MSLRRVKDPARQQQIAAPLVANLQRQKRRHQRRHKSDPDFSESELRRRRRQREIADRRQSCSARDRRAHAPPRSLASATHTSAQKQSRNSLRIGAMLSRASCLACPAMPANRARNKTLPGPRNTSTRQSLARGVLHRGNQLHLHLRSHRVAPLRPIQRNRPDWPWSRNRIVCKFNYLLQRSTPPCRIGCDTTRLCSRLAFSAHLRDSSHQVGTGNRPLRIRRQASPAGFPSACFQPARPAQADIHPIRRWPRRTACNPHGTPRVHAPPLRRAAHASARQSRSRDALHTTAADRFLNSFGIASPTVSASDICSHPDIDQTSRMHSEPRHAPRFSVRISKRHREVGNDIQPCVAPATRSPAAASSDSSCV